MPFEVEPLHIALVAVLIIVLCGWFFMRKNREYDSAGKEMTSKMREHVGDPLDGRGRDESALHNALAADEPDVPMLASGGAVSDTVADDDDGDEETPAQPEAAQPELPLSMDTNHVPEVPMGRRMPIVDSGVDALAVLTPREGMVFSPEKLKAVKTTVEGANGSLGLKVEFFNETTKRWVETALDNARCSQIHLFVLLANRRQRLDELSAAKFLSIVDQVAIELTADAVVPDSSSLIESAAMLGRVIDSFDNMLTVKLVCAQAVAEDLLNDAALACGFVYTQKHYEKRELGMADPIVFLSASAALPNELEMSLDVALVAPSNEPLTHFFALANDLCCRLDAVMTDASGQPIGPAAASMINAQLRSMHSTMAQYGIAAGSSRARRIFSRV